MQKSIFFYKDALGNEPFKDWINRLRDARTRRRIWQRLRRLEQGNYGDCESLGNGVFELRLFFGPGFRVYFGEENDQIVIILCGGDKSSQTRNIKTAKQYWKEFTHDEKEF
jgi:putative addiction module killer protein